MEETVKAKIVHKGNGIDRSLCGIQKDGLGKQLTVFKSLVTCPDCKEMMKK